MDIYYSMLHCRRTATKWTLWLLIVKCCFQGQEWTFSFSEAQNCFLKMHNLWKTHSWCMFFKALSYIRRKAVHSAPQLSLLVSYQRSCHFHTQRPCCVNSKGICAHLCAHWHAGFIIKCGQAHYWLTAILRQQNASAPFTKTWSKVNAAIFSYYLKGAVSSYCTLNKNINPMLSHIMFSFMIFYSLIDWLIDWLILVWFGVW